MKIFGIIGDPIAHTLSPVLHNAAFRALNLPHLYLPFRVTSHDLGRFLKKAKAWRLAGFNVTIPHKEKIMKFLGSVSPEAQAIGAVNTVVLRAGKLRGYNTDALGYFRSLTRETRFRPRGKAVMILGAGGAARALLWGFVRSGARPIYLCNRTPSRAGRVVRAFRHRFRGRFQGASIEKIPLKAGTLSALFPRLDLLVNATSVGLKGTRFKGLPFSRLPKKAIVSDLVYSPRLTPLLKEAKRLGLKTHSGEGMLLEQGALSFELWTGKKPPLLVMRRALLDALRRN